MSDVALLTDSRYTASVAPDGDWYLANILNDDRLLSEALASMGLTSRRVDWADPKVDWTEFRCAVFRTTWDYFNRFAEFESWFQKVEKQTQLINSPKTILWNRDKHYLGDLASQGIAIVPTIFIEAGKSVNLMEYSGTVIKPCISGGARHTHRIDRDNAKFVQEELAPIMAHESFLNQPFQKAILKTGEDSLMLFNGQFTHAVRKIGSNGDFRVQDDFGGTYQKYEPPSDEIEFAERAVQACQKYCGEIPVYARVDIIQANEGHWAIMELELIEPELWLRIEPNAATVFAKGIANSVRSLSNGVQ